MAYNGNGDVMALVDADDGTVAGEYSYGPFNETIKVQGQAAKDNPMRFSTKYLDVEVEILHYELRPMKDGRFMTRDPMDEDGGLGLYVFAGNEPVGWYDPDGREEKSKDQSKRKKTKKTFNKYVKWNYKATYILRSVFYLGAKGSKKIDMSSFPHTLKDRIWEGVLCYDLSSITVNAEPTQGFSKGKGDQNVFNVSGDFRYYPVIKVVKKGQDTGKMAEEAGFRAPWRTVHRYRGTAFGVPAGTKYDRATALIQYVGMEHTEWVIMRRIESRVVDDHDEFLPRLNVNIVGGDKKTNAK